MVELLEQQGVDVGGPCGLVRMPPGESSSGSAAALAVARPRSGQIAEREVLGGHDVVDGEAVL